MELEGSTEEHRQRRSERLDAAERARLIAQRGSDEELPIEEFMAKHGIHGAPAGLGRARGGPYCDISLVAYCHVHSDWGPSLPYLLGAGGASCRLAFTGVLIIHISGLVLDNSAILRFPPTSAF